MRKTNIAVLLLFVLLGGCFQIVYAQPQQPIRLELELDLTDEPYEVESLGADGLILYRFRDENKLASDAPYEFIRYDTALQEVWNKTYRMGREYQLIGWDYHNDSIYFLYEQFGIKEPYQLIKLDKLTGDTTVTNIRKVLPIQLTSFESVGKAIIFAGYVNGRSTVILYNREDGKQRVLPNFYEEQSEIMEVVVDDEAEEFHVTIVNKQPREPFTMTLRTFNADGVLTHEQDLALPEELNILYGRAAGETRGHSVVAGTFSDKRSDYSRGIFVADVDEFGEINYQTYAYADLDNFFNYMKSKRRQRVKRRIERRRIKGRKARFSYRLLVQDIIEKDDYFVLVGEAFYPVYRYYGGSGVASRGASNSSSTYFDGYRYTHAVVMAFNAEGKVLWNNSFEIEGIQSLTLQEFVEVHVNRDRIVLLYLYDGEIRSKVIREDTMEEGKFFDPIEVKFGQEVVQRNENDVSILERWYADYFFAAGVQDIRRLNTRGADQNRRVFYVNKIVYP